MKITAFFISLFLIACTSKDDSSVAPNMNIIGKWAPTYLTQIKNADGTWGEWHTMNTLVALPVYEFTSDGLFLTDGKPGAKCCFAGNKYSVSGSKISFTETMSCPTVFCLACGYWTINEIKVDSLILEECSARNKYIKQK